MNIQVVGGRWDNNGGKPSKLLDAFVQGIANVIPVTKCFNGGYYNDLSDLIAFQLDNPVHSPVQFADILFWFPDIPNSLPKLLLGLKKSNQALILVASKRVDDRDIGLPEVINRMLRDKINLGLVINTTGGRYVAKVIDPLGNLFAEGDDFTMLGQEAIKRALVLKQATRVNGVKIGDALDTDIPEEFLSLIHQYAAEFDRLIPRPKEVSRFLGNAAFRCTYGMPVFRKNELIYVSRRNVDKSGINNNGFVAVNPYKPFMSNVQYYGDNKPSVDTPVNLLLMNRFPNINYMIHGHVYLEHAPMTDNVVPCGAIEEFEELLTIMPNSLGFSFRANLRGHGFIVGGALTDHLKGLKFRARPTEERHF